MRTFLFFAFAILLIGCAHKPKSDIGNVRDIQRLEETCETLREEIRILKRSVTELESHYNNPKVLRDLAQPLQDAAARARSAYSHGERVRDFEAMIRILERQRTALVAELKAYQYNIDIFE